MKKSTQVVLAILGSIAAVATLGRLSGCRYLVPSSLNPTERARQIYRSSFPHTYPGSYGIWGGRTPLVGEEGSGGRGGSSSGTVSRGGFGSGGMGIHSGS